MIKPPSNQNPYTLVYSGDPALNLPADDEPCALALTTARQTGLWQDITLEGQTVTAFDVKPLTGSAFDWWCGEVKRRQLIEQEAAALALRLALVKVTGFGDYKVSHVQVDGIRLTTTAIIDAIYAAPELGRPAVLEFGSAVIERASESPSPK